MTTRPRQSLASPDSKSQMSPDSTNPAPDARPGTQSSLDPKITEALTELATRLERQGVTAKVYVHDGMMSALTHWDGDTSATIDDALVDGTNLIEELAAEIAAEQGLPPGLAGAGHRRGASHASGSPRDGVRILPEHRRQMRNQTG